MLTRWYCVAVHCVYFCPVRYLVRCPVWKKSNLGPNSGSYSGHVRRTRCTCERYIRRTDGLSCQSVLSNAQCWNCYHSVQIYRMFRFFCYAIIFCNLDCMIYCVYLMSIFSAAFRYWRARGIHGSSQFCSHSSFSIDVRRCQTAVRHGLGFICFSELKVQPGRSGLIRLRHARLRPTLRGIVESPSKPVPLYLM